MGIILGTIFLLALVNYADEDDFVCNDYCDYNDYDDCTDYEIYDDYEIEEDIC